MIFQQTNIRYDLGYIAFLGDKRGVPFLLFVDKNRMTLHQKNDYFEKVIESVVRCTSNKDSKSKYRI